MVQDAIDRDLIALLQANARESTANLARKLGIARTTVVARLARLEREGVIVGYTARLGQDEQRPGVIAHVGIAVEPKRSRDVVLRLQAIPELRQLYAVSGEADLIALHVGRKPRMIEVKSTTRGPFAGFPPADRQHLLESAKQAGAQAWLVWWPSRGKPRWIPPGEWPKAKT